MIDRDEEMTLESPRTRQEVQEVMKETEWKETRGREEEAWRLSQKGKRRCRRLESLRMGSKAPAWTLMVKATMDEGKAKITEVEVACQEKKVKKLKARREK